MITICLLAAKLLLTHPFHVSVCDVSYDSDDKHLKISVRLFLDDLENAIRLYKNQEKLIITNPEDSVFIHQSINEYLQRNLIFSIDGNKYIPNYLGGETDMDVMWCYLEVKKLDPFSKIELTNTILTELFDDQENLVTIEKDQKARSIRFTNRNMIDTFSWE
jgi:hypothetical protein